MPIFRILVLGGYGQFGQRIVAALARDADLLLLVSGRHVDAAQRLVDRLADGALAGLQAVAIDLGAPDFADRLAALAPHLVIHTAGPFQGSDYRVARACLACGAHYVDLADGREFVRGIDALDAAAQAAWRWVIAGASSVPGLSTAVVEHLLPQFSRLDSIEAAISPGNRTDRGLATTRAILGYVGQPYRLLRDGRWTSVHGWQSLRRLRVRGAGTRWLARCEVPDLDVLSARYPQLRDCDFRAGLELRRMHWGLWLASWAVRARLLRSLAPFAERLLAISQRWINAGSDTGVMAIELRGLDLAGRPLRLQWTLLAHDGDGPQVPATAAVILARKLARGALPGGGARACVDLFTLDEFLQALDGLSVETSLRVLPAL
ncbi:saccharopine dehydrogenase family protein [Montanilutibacter psychrotolerans]|uniref:Saccharopine dehydrogenase n=1 Tax=Montanilutibacter psychrotolerans TaxID=1327343 RepID=A0A3M8SYA8_9GAMM|nr:saccharopine dehydrogenase NADP-binding domain-containing protein [Lysobacter psychrotolerans]RNF84244.1 saccharopine dehydrogenase [Lysobacter psychrotolerans]